MQEQQEDYTGVITASMLWDMLPAEAVVPLCAEAGVIPPDAEGAAFERACSDARRAVIRPLLPWIEVLSVIAAEIEGIVSVRSISPSPSPQETRMIQEARDMFEMAAHDHILPAACAIISILVERGFLQVTDRGRAPTLDAFIGS
jgi:hypothetical protein